MNLNFNTGEELFQFLLVIVLLVLSVILLAIVLNMFSVVSRSQKGNDISDQNEESSIWDRLTNAVPLENEESVLLTEHNYDGIKELDNHLPPWWIGLFYGTIIFAVLYLLNYQVWKWSPSQEEEYEIAMNDAKKEVDAYQAKLGASIDEKSVKILTDNATISNGKTIFTEKCVACHGASGEGSVGPNLTDDYWLHGGSIGDIFSTISNGVPDKGMISWKASLKPNQIQEVANFILTLHGTKPANPKAPQGTIYKAEAAADSTKK